MRGSLVLASFLCLSACVREEKLVDRFVEDYCEARWSCGCDSPGLTQVHCESLLTRAGEEAQDAAQDAGLEYDRECAKAWLDAIDDACSVQAMPNYTECGDPCAPYHGNERVGEACQHFGPWSDCARELRCGLGSTCEDPCLGQHEGDPCAPDVGGSCGPDLTCVEGACVPAPALGEPCQGECRVGARCDFDQQRCVESPGFGEPCSDIVECGRNLLCVRTEDGEQVCDVGKAKVCGLGTPW